MRYENPKSPILLFKLKYQREKGRFCFAGGFEIKTIRPKKKGGLGYLLLTQHDTTDSEEQNNTVFNRKEKENNYLGYQETQYEPHIDDA